MRESHHQTEEIIVRVGGKGQGEFCEKMRGGEGARNACSSWTWCEGLGAEMNHQGSKTPRHQELTRSEAHRGHRGGLPALEARACILWSLACRDARGVVYMENMLVAGGC